MTRAIGRKRTFHHTGIPVKASWQIQTTKTSYVVVMCASCRTDVVTIKMWEWNCSRTTVRPLTMSWWICRSMEVSL